MKVKSVYKGIKGKYNCWILSGFMFPTKQSVETYCDCYCSSFLSLGAVAIVIVWLLDLQLPIQSMPITTNIVSLNPVQARCTRHNIM